MSETRTLLMKAEKLADELFQAIESSGLISAGKSEQQLNTEIFNLADERFGIKKYWHKRIVRAGRNTLFPYKDNPPDLFIREDDILFFDFGPILDQWEADYGRTYVIGHDPVKLKLKHDIEAAWYETRDWFRTRSSVTGAELFTYAEATAKKYKWTFGGEIAGHIIGHFPHEKLETGNFDNYVHPENNRDMFSPGADGKRKEWILEMHFVDREREIGGFFEQLLT